MRPSLRMERARLSRPAAGGAKLLPLCSGQAPRVGARRCAPARQAPDGKAPQIISSREGLDPYAAAASALGPDGGAPPPGAGPIAGAAAAVAAAVEEHNSDGAAGSDLGAAAATPPDAPAVAAAAEAAPIAAAAGAAAAAAAKVHAAAAAPSTYEAVLGRVLQLAVPLMVQNIAGYSISIIGAVFIGRLGPLLLSASVLANSLYNCTGLSIAIGLSAGLETLCGQAYGAGNYKAMGLLLQRALAICVVACVPIALLWLGSQGLLGLMGQEADIAAHASRYLIFCIPCLFLSISTECLRRYLQSQREVRPAMIMAAAATAAAPLLFWAGIPHAGWGLDGAALAFVGCQAIQLAGLAAFAVARARRMAGDARQAWHGWSAEAFSGWGEYLHYGLPAAAMICMEWWAFEVIILWAGLLPDAMLTLSTMGICLSLNAYMYMLPLGLASSINTNVANALGGGDGARAKKVFAVGLGLAVALQAAIVAGVMGGGKQLVKLFCSDPQIVARCLDVLPLLAALIAFDGVNANISGVLRGCGRQKLGAAVNFLGYVSRGRTHVLGGARGACCAGRRLLVGL
ncbi:MAG: mate-domain-containing protein [Monoraphidium minutum]|nr:MAG: mate-domain-containing protein [Monoraphidium minutum]